MRSSQPVRIGARLLVALNLLMAFGSIWVFMRMAPAIDRIIDRNEVSLEASEEMLALLVPRAGSQADVDERHEAFGEVLERAGNNITEVDEPEAIARIEASYPDALAGDPAAARRTVDAILDLGNINQEAMRRADVRARRLGYAGAWGVVFMATTIFLVGLLFLRSMRRNLSDPLNEIDAAISAFRTGETMRRCTAKDPPDRIRYLFSIVNELLDRCATPRPDFGRHEDDAGDAADVRNGGEPGPR